MKGMDKLVTLALASKVAFYYSLKDKRPCNAEDGPIDPMRAICILDSQPNEVGKGVV